VVAEGVDAEEQANMLRLLGCDQMQGLSLQQTAAGRSADALTGCNSSGNRSEAPPPEDAFFREASVNRPLNLLAALVVLGGCVNAKQAPPAPQPPESFGGHGGASHAVPGSFTELPGPPPRTCVAQVTRRAATALCQA